MAPAKRGANGGDKRQPLWDSDKDLKAEDLDLSTSEDESDEEGDREQEIADAVMFLSNGSYITGQVTL